MLVVSDQRDMQFRFLHVKLEVQLRLLQLRSLRHRTSGSRQVSAFFGVSCDSPPLTKLASEL